MEIIRAGDRGFFDYGWLKTFHTFSFSEYYNPKRMHFGVLRVVNDDLVQGNNGFGMHSHQNMEIVSIPLSGKLEHEDSTGRKGIVEYGEVQVMSAGTGIKHSERNPANEPVSFLQLWIIPHTKNVEPRHEQMGFDEAGWKNKLQLLVSPGTVKDSLWIHQNAYVSRIEINNGNPYEYVRFEKGNGVFLFILEGEIAVFEHTLSKRDTLLLQPEERVEIRPSSHTRILFIEVPLS